MSSTQQTKGWLTLQAKKRRLVKAQDDESTTVKALTKTNGKMTGFLFLEIKHANGWTFMAFDNKRQLLAITQGESATVANAVLAQQMSVLGFEITPS